MQELSIFAPEVCDNYRMNNWDDVRFFLQVARSGNVTSAARALGVNHSTVTRRISALEDRYGVRLFERIPSGYQLTEDAAEIFDLALEIESQNQTFARKLQGQDARLQGKVSITMPDDIFHAFMVGEFVRLQQQYPDLVLNILVDKGLKNLIAREADIAIRVTANPPDYLIGKQASHLEYALFQPRNLNVGDFTPIITWESENAVPSWANDLIEHPKIVMQVNDLLSMYSAVAAGLGVARMPVFIDNMRKDKRVLRRPDVLPASGWGVWVLSHVDLRKTARVQACRNFILNSLEENKALFTT